MTVLPLGRQFDRASIESDTVRVWLLLPGERFRMEVELVDLSVAGASVRLQNESPLRLGVGGELEVVLQHRQLNGELKLRARLSCRREDIARRHLRLDFLDQDAANGLTHPELARLFNRRAALRVQPASNDTFQVTLIPPRETRLALETARLVDLSTGGLGVDVTPGFEAALGHRDLIDLLFRLPNHSEPFTVRGRVRYRALQKDGMVRYGIMFVDTETHAFRRVYDGILDYVLRRHQDLTRDWEENKNRRP